MSLAAELKALQAKFVADIPKEVSDLFDKTTEELAESGVVEQAIKVGDKAPDFTLPDSNGNDVNLGDLLKRGPVVLSFYRGTWCPYCNLAVRSLQKHKSDFEAKGANLVVVSAELPDYINIGIKKNELTYPVLSDVGLKVGTQYGLRFVLDERLQKVYTEFGLDVPSHNGDKTFQLPLPATYVIKPDGTVSFAFADADYTKRAEPADILKALA